jgi:tRNA/tmRNA/rRNA uracil-C5-methylase (TrmA/RlmC/RlmD family)
MKKITLQEEKEIIYISKTAKTLIRKLAEQFKTSKSAIYRIISKDDSNYNSEKNSVLESNNNNKNETFFEKTLKYRGLDSVVFEVFMKFRANFISINGSVLKKVALKAANELKIFDFKA